MAANGDNKKNTKFANTLEDLYRHLSPLGVDSELNVQRSIDTRSSAEIIKDGILGPSGDVYSWDRLSKDINDYFTSKNANTDEKDELAQGFHAISTKGKIDLGDAQYWGETTKDMTSFVTTLSKTLKDNKPCIVSAYVSRDPYISPSTRSTDDVEIFLNYMPSIAVAQMVPFLDVEFEMMGQINSSYMTTPSYMRFLLGSGDVKQQNEYDRALINADIVDQSKVETKVRGQKNPRRGTKNIMRSGIESFLMPVTLTNMDELSPGKNRLVRARPFVPFASIEGFDVSIMNAGAGSMVHKTGSLKIKLHDKSRLTEFSEFLRGPSGYASVRIWTKYGWSAPQNRGDEDAYSKFINTKMQVEDCWMVKDSQFSFDNSGQVVFTVQLVSSGVKDIQNLMISAGSNELADNLKKLKKATETIAFYNDLLRRSEAFSYDLSAKELINAAATTGNIGKFKNIGLITKKIQAISERSSLSKKEAQELKDQIDSLLSEKGGGLYDNFNNSIPGAIEKKFNQLSEGDDPFLPRNITSSGSKNVDVKATEKYFPDSELIKEIENFRKIVGPRNEKIKNDLKQQTENKARSGSDSELIKPITLNQNVNIVSFGKLFLNFVASALVTLEQVDEIQVFFYPINEFSGPMSGYSLAEFPIDSTALAYSYAEELKRMHTDELTLQQFLKLIIDSQFSDARAIGYGRNNIYKAFTPGSKGKAERRDEPDAESADATWSTKYGGWRPPLIDFYIETGEYVESSSGSRTFTVKKHRSDRSNSEKTGLIIKRLHVFDKQVNPHRLAQSILSGDQGFERGEINKGRVQGAMKQILNNRKKQQQFAKKIDEKIRSINSADTDQSADVRKQQKERLEKTKTALKESGIGLPTTTEAVSRPGKESFQINFMGNKREIIKSELMRFVPTLSPGTNGSLIRNINVGSKTDGLIGAANLFRVVKGGTNKNNLSDNGLEEANELPLRVVPIQLTMTTLGCPNAALYQDYFIDMNTGTTIDNIYKASQIQHIISPGKFDTNWTFIFSDGYGKFNAPPSIEGLILGEVTKFLKNFIDEK